jgi:porin
MRVNPQDLDWFRMRSGRRHLKQARAWLAAMVSALAVMQGIAAEEKDGKQAAYRPRLSTDEVGNQQVLDRKANPLYESKLLAPVVDARDALAEQTGLNMSLDYTAQFMELSEGLGEDSASGGMVRFFGSWLLVDRKGPNQGSLNWKLEHRHKYSSTPVGGFPGLAQRGGYVGIFEPPFTDQGGRLTMLNWKQYVAGGKGTLVAGFLDITDYVDVYLLASPWLGFNNFVFSTGSAAMDTPNDAALGTAAGGLVAENIYIQAGVVDALSDPTEPWDGFDTFFNDNQYFSWAELGWTPGKEKIYFDNAHITAWHKDDVGGNPDGWGLNASCQRWIDDQWLPFVRAGYTRDSGSLLERSVSTGVGYQPVPLRGVIGLGFNWGRPNESSFGNVDDQLSSELFWRYQLTRELALTPSIQYINNPALNPTTNHLWAFGLRVRVVL